MILLDECVQARIGAMLVEAGIPVVKMWELGAGAADPVVLRLAQDRRLIVLTRDKDFGDLVFRDRLPAYGVVLYRLPSLPFPEICKRVVGYLVENQGALAGNFTLLDGQGARVRPLPVTLLL